MNRKVKDGSSPQGKARNEGLSAGCPMSGLLDMLTRPWTMHILWLLGSNGPMRFGALRRSVEGISARLLTVRLRTLESRGFVRRYVGLGKAPEVMYAPTDRIADMHEFMAQLQQLSAKWQREDDRQAAVGDAKEA